MAYTNLRFEPILPPSARGEGATASEHQIGHIIAAAHTSTNRRAYKASASKAHCRASEPHTGPLLYQDTVKRSHRAQRPRSNRFPIKSPDPIQSVQKEPQGQQQSGNADDPILIVDDLEQALSITYGSGSPRRQAAGAERRRGGLTNTNNRMGELRQSPRIVARRDGRVPPRPPSRRRPRSFGKGYQASRGRNAVAVEKIRARAQCELARVESVQARADEYASKRHQLSMAASAVQDSSNDPVLPNESDSARRPSHLKEQPRRRCDEAAASHVKRHDGIQYEQQATGPFRGMLASRGAIVNIDGENYVECSILTKLRFA